MKKLEEKLYNLDSLYSEKLKYLRTEKIFKDKEISRFFDIRTNIRTGILKEKRVKDTKLVYHFVKSKANTILRVKKRFGKGEGKKWKEGISSIESDKDMKYQLLEKIHGFFLHLISYHSAELDFILVGIYKGLENVLKKYSTRIEYLMCEFTEREVAKALSLKVITIGKRRLTFPTKTFFKEVFESLNPLIEGINSLKS